MRSYEWIVTRCLSGIEFHQNRYARELDGVVTSGCRWLDVGAGVQIHWGWIGPGEDDLVSRARSVIGCDLVPEHLEQNRRLTGAVVADAGGLPFRDGSFDLVTANMVLEHLPEPAQVLGEVFRVLAPGGRFVFVTPNSRHPVVRLLALILSPRWQRALTHAVEGRPLEHIFLTRYLANSRREIEELARSAGLLVTRLEVFSSYPMLSRPALATLLEAAWIRLVEATALRPLGSNLLGVLVRPPAASAREELLEASAES